jgi:hypothetical protein
MHSSDHLIGVSVRCRECGEPAEVPAKSAPNVPRATQPSGIMRATTSAANTPDDPLDQGPVEAGWHRLQDSTARLLPKTGHGLLFAGLGALVVGLALAALGWWLSHR